MAKSLNILHLFDLYLPHTMNWAYQLALATPDIMPWIAAPWIVRNRYYHPEFRFFIRPLQRRLHWLPETEWQASRFSGTLIRAERYWPLYKSWLEKQLRRDRPDLLHAHFAPVGCHYLDLAQRLDIPLVTSFYGYDYESLPARNPVWRTRYRQLFAGAGATTCAGPFGRTVLMQQGLPPEKITVLPMSMRPDAFPFIPRIKKPGQLRLLQVATLTEKKGYRDTLQALELARRNCPNLHLTIAGERYDPQLVAALKAYIERHGLQSFITWLDFFPHENLPAFLGQFDVFIHPSHYTANRDCEGGPVAILEAQATGLPVISTTHFDIPSEVMHGKTGLLAPENDPVQLAKYIERFYNMQNEEYQQFSEAARRHVERNFDIRNTAQKLRTLYEKLT